MAVFDLAGYTGSEGTDGEVVEAGVALMVDLASKTLRNTTFNAAGSIGRLRVEVGGASGTHIICLTKYTVVDIAAMALVSEGTEAFLADTA